VQSQSCDDTDFPHIFSSINWNIIEETLHYLDNFGVATTAALVSVVTFGNGGDVASFILNENEGLKHPVELFQ
jgi:hypothetical protein